MAKLTCNSGYVNASTLVLNNSCGVGFEEVFKDEFEKLGGTVTNHVRYDIGRAPFDSEIDEVSAMIWMLSSSLSILMQEVQFSVVY